MIKKICNISSTIILIIMITIAAILLIPKIFGYETYAVLSGSMEPKFSVGSIVFVDRINPEEVKTDDVISFILSGNGKVATHRVIEVNSSEKQFITKGDANEDVDTNPVNFTDLIGKVKFNVPLLGFISIYIKTKLGIFIGVGLMLLLGVLNFLPDLLEK